MGNLPCQPDRTLSLLGGTLWALSVRMLPERFLCGKTHPECECHLIMDSGPTIKIGSKGNEEEVVS